MAKVNSSTSRQTSALADDEDDLYLRPSVPATPGGRRSRSNLRPDPSEQAEAFLRTRRRVAPRKVGWLRAMLGNRWGRYALLVLLLLLVGVLCAGAWAIRSFLESDPHFRIDDSADIQTVGASQLSRADLLQVFGSDSGRNIFFVPLAKREAVLEAEPWVRHATVMRLLPHTIRVAVSERTPVAFVRIGHTIELVDAEGVLLPVAPSTLTTRHYSFPVVTGLDPGASAQDRAARMHLFAQFVAALDAGGARNSGQLSEVDLSDTDDLRAVVPAQGTDILLHFGSGDFRARWNSYEEHIAAWRQQYPNLSAVDLRYERQVVLKMAEAAQADQSAEAKPLPGADVAAESTSAPAHAAVPHASQSAHGAPRKHARKWKPHYIAHAGSPR